MRPPIDTASVKDGAIRTDQLDSINRDATIIESSIFENVRGKTHERDDSTREVVSSPVVDYAGRLPTQIAGKSLGDLMEYDKIDRQFVTCEPLLFTVVEVAGILKLSRTEVYELLYSGSLPSVKIGASRRVKRADLEKFVMNLEPAI